MAAFAKGARDGNIPLRAFFLRDLQSGGLRLPRGGCGLQSKLPRGIAGSARLAGSTSAARARNRRRIRALIAEVCACGGDKFARRRVAKSV